MSYGTMLREWRGRKGWTQRQLADAIGCTDGYIAHLENEVKQPSLDICIALEQVLQLTSEEQQDFLKAIEEARYKSTEERIRNRGSAVRDALLSRCAVTVSPESTSGYIDAESIARDLVTDPNLRAAYRDLKIALTDPRMRAIVLNLLRTSAQGSSSHTGIECLAGGDPNQEGLYSEVLAHFDSLGQLAVRAIVQQRLQLIREIRDAIQGRTFTVQVYRILRQKIVPTHLGEGDKTPPADNVAAKQLTARIETLAAAGETPNMALLLAAGLAYEATGDPLDLERAASYYRRASKQSPDRYEPHILLGRALSLRGLHQESDAALREAARLLEKTAQMERQE